MQYIGSELQDRMNLLGIDVSTLAEITFMDEETISDIIENRVSYEDIDEFDMSLICSALHCDVQYFVDDEVKNKDLLISTMSRNDSGKSNNVTKLMVKLSSIFGKIEVPEEKVDTMVDVKLNGTDKVDFDVYKIDKSSSIGIDDCETSDIEK